MAGEASEPVARWARTPQANRGGPADPWGPYTPPGHWEAEWVRTPPVLLHRRHFAASRPRPTASFGNFSFNSAMLSTAARRGRRNASRRHSAGRAVGLPFRSFLRGNLLGAVLFVPDAVGIGYAIGYGLGPYMAHVQHALGGIGCALVPFARIVVVVLIKWRMIIRFVRLGVMRTIRTGV